MVGELHSLTDWQVSEASEDAELEDFCHAEASRQADRRGGRRRGENRSGHSTGMQRGLLTQQSPPHALQGHGHGRERMQWKPTPRVHAMGNDLPPSPAR